MPFTAEHAEIIAAAQAGQHLSPGRALALASCDDLPLLMRAAEALALRGHGRVVSYSRKVFIPLTQLCRDACGYCTFAKAPQRLERAYLSPDEVMALACAGRAAGCSEALFTLGDKPELRHPAARQALAELGYASTIDYLEAMSGLVMREAGLLPHLNPGLLNDSDLARLRRVSVSMGMMLESNSPRLAMKAGPHWRAPDKDPELRLAAIRAAGEHSVPFTSGILIGIGETRRERIEALLALRALHEEFGHIQEVIIQNFLAKPRTRMASAPEPDLDDHLWSIAVARLVLGSGMSIQAPPNLRPEHLRSLILAGINDWGGVSPVTPDYVNPEAPWPELLELERQTRAAGRQLVGRLPLMPAYVQRAQHWVDAAVLPTLLSHADGSGRARADGWRAGAGDPLPAAAGNWVAGGRNGFLSPELADVVAQAAAGEALEEEQVVTLFGAVGDDMYAVFAAADQLRAATVGDSVSYVINRNINYTNICSFRCSFCAFAKGRSATALRGPAYRLGIDEIAARSVEAWERGATEVCLQGGIHPEYTGRTYLDIVDAVKTTVPAMHVHAFSPLEVMHGASTLRMPLRDYLASLRAAGLSTLPGTAAEILDDEVRAVLCPDKLSTAEWLEVMRAAHEGGLRSTATIMFGHVEQPRHWARHLLRIRRLQAETGGFTEVVPLPYVHMEAPLWRKGRSRPGPTLREAVLMHAVTRLVMHPLIPNIQTSWVKMGRDGASLCLRAGANDLGGTLMNESITRAAGGVNGQECMPHSLEAIAAGIGRRACQRTTLYAAPVRSPVMSLRRAGRL